MSDLENTYTSTDDKLLKGGLDRLLEFQKTGLLRPQSLQLAPADACQLDCVWCSTKYRNFDFIPAPNEPSRGVIGDKKASPDYIKFRDIMDVTFKLMDIGPIKTVECTGAGDPLMYRDPEAGKDMNDVVHMLADCGLEVGMITNGVGLTSKLEKSTIDRLTWLRVSLATFDPQNFHKNNDGSNNKKYIGKMPDLPHSMKGQLGFSYVWGPYSEPSVLDRIAEYAQEHQVDFVRIVPDCLDVEKQGEFKDNVGEIITRYNDKIGREVLFFQSKRYDVHSYCAIGFLKPFLNADGYFYHCSAVPLYNQKFTPHWRMGHMSEVEDIWTSENVGKFNTSKCEYGKCFYAAQNEILDAVSPENQDNPHRSFI